MAQDVAFKALQQGYIIFLAGVVKGGILLKK